jgi:hypothetical protein
MSSRQADCLTSIVKPSNGKYYARGYLAMHPDAASGVFSPPSP